MKTTLDYLQKAAESCDEMYGMDYSLDVYIAMANSLLDEDINHIKLLVLEKTIKAICDE